MRAEHVLTLALALALALPVVEGHVVAFTQAAPMVLGPYNALVQPKPDPMYANSALSMTAIFSRAEDGRYAEVPATLQLAGPHGLNKSTELQPDGTGYNVASIAVPYSGNYTARIVVTDKDGATYANQTNFFAYPDLPVRIQGADPNQVDPNTNVSYPIEIQTADNFTLRPTDASITDMTITLEHWSDDHRVMYWAEPFAMTHKGKGLWTLDYVFPSSGMYHLRFSSESGGFGIDDVPVLHVTAHDPTGGAAKRSPGTATVGVLSAFIIASVLVARRGRRVH